jgi:4-hydroxy-tetrahydrodipicolinate synthase
MKKLYPLSGIVTVLNTPFTRDNKIDYDALALNIQDALKAGVAGFLVPAMASEVSRLTNSEKIGMVEKTLNEAGSLRPVFAGTAAESLEASKKLMKAYQDIGCSHFLVQVPFKTRGQFRKEFYELTALDPEVIMLQDWDPQGYGLDDELILELFEEVPSFRCLKVETVPAGVKYTKMLELTRGRLHVSGGWAVTQMPEALQRGVHAFMPTGMHWIYTSIFDMYQRGDQKGAVDLFHKVLPVLAFSNQHLDISIHFFKRLLWRQGIYPGTGVREPILPFDRVHQELADMFIARILDIENQIKGLG